MIDREKVIKGLEVCIARIPGEYTCTSCPYEIDGNDCEINLSNDALTLLREQGPVKPKTDGTSIYDVDGLIVCGKCGGSLGMPEVFKFCPWCGRAVSWDAAD